MTRPDRFWPTVALALISQTLVSADDQPTDPPLPGIDRWIQDLGSDSFIQRDFAGRQLLRVGMPAIAPLVGAAGGDDDVAAQSAIQLLARIARDDRGELGTAAHRGLARLSGDAETLSSRRREAIRQLVRTADRRIAGFINSRSGVSERDDSLEILGVQVHGKHFTDEHARLLARLIHLRRLDLRDTSVSDEAIDTILNLPQLEELNLSDTAVTGEGLQRLAPLKSLKKLSIYRLEVPLDDMESVRAVLPNCEIRK